MFLVKMKIREWISTDFPPPSCPFKPSGQKKNETDQYHYLGLIQNKKNQLNVVEHTKMTKKWHEKPSWE